jgi:hypothetical protein
MSHPGGPDARTGFGDPREARAQASAEKAYRKAQRPWYKKKRFIVPLALVLLIAVVSALSGGGGGAATTAPGGPAAAQDPAAPPAFPGAASGDVVAQAGAAVDVDGLTMTVTALTPGDDTLGDTLCTTVSYANGTSAAASFSLFDWKLQDPNGTILNTGIVGSQNPLSTGEIAPGGNASGDVCFDAPQGSPSGQYVVLLDPSFSFTSERVAWLNTL